MRVMLAALVLAACGTVEQRPPEVRTNTITVEIPIAVPCFTENQKPVLVADIIVDPETATTEQLIAAKLANALALEAYTEAVDRLFLQCSTKG